MSSRKHHNSAKLFRYDVPAILKRLKFHYRFDNDSELAAFLGVKHTSIANWKTRNTFPADVLFAKCSGLNLNWLIYGDEQDGDFPQISAKMPSDSKQTGIDYSPIPFVSLKKFASVQFPESAQEMLEGYPFRDGIVEWSSIPEDLRQKLNWKYEQCKLDAEEGYREYERIAGEAQREYMRKVERINTIFIRYFLNLLSGEEHIPEG